MNELDPNTKEFWSVPKKMGRGPKARCNAILKSGLRPEAQELVAEWCAKPSERDAAGKVIRRTGGPLYATDRLREAAEIAGRPELAVNARTVDRFISYWELAQDLQLADELEKQVLAESGDPAKARAAGEIMLCKLSLARKSATLFLASSRSADNRRLLDLKEDRERTRAEHKATELRLRERSVGLSEMKFHFSASKTVVEHGESLKLILRDPSLSIDEKIAAVQLKLFGPVPPEFADKFGPFRPSAEEA